MIKYDVGANSPSLNLLSGSTLNWLGTPYRPVVLTARHDHSVGQPLTVPSGTLSGYYATTALKLDNLGVVTLTNLSLRHASIGIETIGNTALTLRHAQFVNCGTAVKNGLAVTLQNALFHNVANVLWQTGSTGSTGEFITVDSAQYANYATSGGTLTLKNSILANVVNPNTGVIPPNTFIATLPIFATAGAGAHYLDVDKAWVQAANVTGTIAAPLNSELAGMTVRPPGLLPAAVTADLTLPALPIAEGTDSAKWRWGYHYWPVHYLAPGTTVTGAAVTLTHGVVVAGTEGTAFMLASGGKFTSTGRPDALDRLVYASTVQEQPSAVVPSLTARRFLDVATGTPAVRPEVRLRFTAMDYPADAATRRALLNVDNRYVGVTDFRDSQFRGVKFTLAPAASPSPAQTVTFVNNLWQACDVTVYRFYDAYLSAVVRHNLFNGGSLSLQYTSFANNPTWTVRDDLFDGTTLSTSIPVASLFGGWNGYSAATATFGGSGNVLNLVIGGSGGYLAGPLGGFYYPTTGTGLNTLRNAGSQSASLAGLFHHTTRVDQMKDSADNPAKVDVGFHYVATTGPASTALPAADVDTLPDYLEDADGNGAKGPTETDWQSADTDADGALDQEEIAGGTDPLSKASWIPKRLAYWSWDGAGNLPTDVNYWKKGDRGQMPVQENIGTRIGGVAGGTVGGIQFPNTSSGRLRYLIREADGRLNVRLDQGGIRFWFKPDWTVTSTTFGTMPPKGNAANVNLFGVGNYGAPTYWGWYLYYPMPASGGLHLDMVQVGDNTQNSADFVGSVARMDLPLNLHANEPQKGDWTASERWHQLDLSYIDKGIPIPVACTDPQTGLPIIDPQTGLAVICSYAYTIGTWAQENGDLQAWGCNLTTGVCLQYGGITGTHGLVLPLGSTVPTPSFTIGSDDSGTFNQAHGTFDSVETFNWPLGEVDNYTRQQLTAKIVAPAQLEFSRPFDGTAASVGQRKSLPWRLRLSRRELTPTLSSTWTVVRDETVSGGSAIASFSDSVVPGSTYEYTAEFPDNGSSPQNRRFVAGIGMPPLHYRGNVVRLVETNLYDALNTLDPGQTISDLAKLQSALVGDGWTVKTLKAPRHDDLTWGKNVGPAHPDTGRRLHVENLIAANVVTGAPNVIYILGHVVIPYSGLFAHDGHTKSQGDHRGAWTCDAYYGDLVKSGWTDTYPLTDQPMTPPGTFDSEDVYAVRNDGKFDQSFLPRVPACAVGRLDFAGLPVLSTSFSPAITDPPALEIALTKRYLAKNFKYRANGVPTFGRVSAYVGNAWGINGVNAAQSFSGAAFGTEPGRVFHGYNLSQKVPADLGVHFRMGFDNYVDYGVSDGMDTLFTSDSFANAAMEVPVTFRHVWFSYASDWARISPATTDNSLILNGAYRHPNNCLRASLAWPNHGLAIVGGPYWDFSPLGAGAPLAEMMTRGWQSQTPIPAFQTILGDPTLRLFRVTPPQNVKKIMNGTTSVTLTWDLSNDPDTYYYIYRTTNTNGLDGFTLETPTKLSGTSFTQAIAASTSYTYMVRASKLQTSGVRSFWNLSQGTFITVP